MPPIPEIATVLTAPTLVAVFTGWLSHNGLPKWVNTIIVFFVVVIVSFVYAVLSNKITGDLLADMSLIAALCIALTFAPASPLYSLREWLTVKLVSPFALFAPTSGLIGSQGTASQAVSAVPARASRPAAATWPATDTTMPTNSVPPSGGSVIAPPDQTHSDGHG